MVQPYENGLKNICRYAYYVPIAMRHNHIDQLINRGKMMLKLEEEKVLNTVIKVVGVGGAGTNAVNRMISTGMQGIDFIVVNTDAQQLKESLAPTIIQIGSKLTRGLGAGADPDVGREAANEDRDKIQKALKGADMVFITAGMGRGNRYRRGADCGRDCQRDAGACCRCVVTKPFKVEGKKRMERAEIGMRGVREKVDTLITIHNDLLLKIIDRKTPMEEAFKLADDILRQGCTGNFGYYYDDGPCQC